MGRISARAVFWGERNLEWTYVKNTPWPLLLFTLPGHVPYNVAAALYFTRSGHLRTFLSAKWHAISELPRVWRQRRDIQRRRRTSLLRLWKLMDRGWIAPTIREKRFDVGFRPSP